jgi:23S rRNA pseudouridine1911/1915/1917 synthase
MRPGIVHRLDKDTSGLLIVAKNDTAHQSLATQFAARTVIRAYYAICLGRIEQERFCVDQPIGRHPIARKKMAVISADKCLQNGRTQPKSRRAITYVTVFERGDRYTLVGAQLKTGRTHQIRVHLAYTGYPVLGDSLYGSSKQPLGISGQILHAAWLKFIHPTTNEKMQFNSVFPEYFLEALTKTGLDNTGLSNMKGRDTWTRTF